MVFSGIWNDLQVDSSAVTPLNALYAQFMSVMRVTVTIIASMKLSRGNQRIFNVRYSFNNLYTTNPPIQDKIIRLDFLACHLTYGSASGVPLFASSKSGPRKRYAMSALIRVVVSSIRIVLYCIYSIRKTRIMQKNYSIRLRICHHHPRYIVEKIVPAIITVVVDHKRLISDWRKLFTK